MNIADIISRIRVEINDRDKDRFEDPILIAWVNEAMQEIWQRRPDIFHVVAVVKLREGSRQQACCCQKISKVHAITDAHGNDIAEIREIDRLAIMHFKKKNCADGYPTGYYLDPKDDSSFYVVPPLSPNYNMWVRIGCAEKPEELPLKKTKKQLPEYFESVLSSVVDYVIYRALGTEHESQTSQAKAELSYKRFMERLGLEAKAKIQYKVTNSRE